MPITFVKTAQEKQADQTSLVKMLEKQIGGMDKARSIYTINASALTKDDLRYCPRERALMHIQKVKPKDRYIDPAMRLTFDIGEAYHDLIRNRYFRDLAVGDWKCVHCGTTVVYSRYPKVGCKACGCKNYVYHEPRFVHPTGASGGMDLVLAVGTAKHRLVEIKSISKDDFAKLSAPLGEHRTRTALYLRIIKESGDPRASTIDLTQATLLYVSKGYGSKQESGKVTPFKEFLVKADAADVTPYLKWSEETSVFFKTGKIPERCCNTGFDKRAKSCPMSGACWMGDFMPGSIYEGDLPWA